MNDKIEAEAEINEVKNQPKVITQGLNIRRVPHKKIKMIVGSNGLSGPNYLSQDS